MKIFEENYKVLKVLPINKSTLKAEVRFRMDPGNELVACELHCDETLLWLRSEFRRYDFQLVLDLMSAGFLDGAVEATAVHYNVYTALSQYFMLPPNRNSDPSEALQDFLMSPRWDAWANAHPARKPNTSEPGARSKGKKRA